MDKVRYVPLCLLERQLLHTPWSMHMVVTGISSAANSRSRMVHKPKWHVRKWRTVWRHGVLWCLSAIVLHEWSMWLKWQGRHHNVWHYTMKIQHLPYTISTLPTAIWPTNLKYTVRIYADPVQSSNALIVLYTYWTRLWSEFTMGEMPHTLIH